MDYYAQVMNIQYGLSIKEALKDSIPLVTGLMRPIFEQIDPIEMGGYRRAIAIGEEYAKRMLQMSGNRQADEIIRRTVWGYPAHDFCIDPDEAASLGLPVERLSPTHEKLFTEVLFSVDREAFYGFAPPKPSVKREVRRKSRKAKPRAKRLDQGSGPRPTERVSA
jgi:hypothetical protein